MIRRTRLYWVLMVAAVVLLVSGYQWTDAYLSSKALQKAVVQGQLQTVRFILSWRPKLIDTPDFEERPLLTAIEKNQLEIVRFLLDQGASPNVVTGRCWTPIHLAVYHDNIEMVKLLLDHGADPNLEDACGKKPLNFVSFQHSNLEMWTLLLNQGANPNDQDGNSTPLWCAMSSQKEDAWVKLLLEKGANPNSKLDRPPSFCEKFIIDDRQTGAYYSSRGFLCSVQGRVTPMDYCVRDRVSAERIRLLIEYGAKPEKPLVAYLAAGRGWDFAYEPETAYLVFKWLLDNGLEPDLLRKYLPTAVRIKEARKVALLLIERGVSIQERDERQDMDCLFLAVENLDAELVEALLKKGADPNVMSLLGIYTPMSWLACGGQGNNCNTLENWVATKKAIELLMAYKASPKLCFEGTGCAWDQMESGHCEWSGPLVEAYLRRGGDPSHVGWKGQTLLHSLASQRWIVGDGSDEKRNKVLPC